MRGGAAALAGTGLGAVAGTMAAGALSSAGDQAVTQKDSAKEAVEENKKKLEETNLQTLKRYGTDPVWMGTPASAAALISWKLNKTKGAMNKRYNEFLQRIGSVGKGAKARQLARELQGKLTSTEINKLKKVLQNKSMYPDRSRQVIGLLGRAATRGKVADEASVLRKIKAVKAAKAAAPVAAITPFILTLLDKTLANPTRKQWMAQQGY
jgi:hypothetical protein